MKLTVNQIAAIVIVVMIVAVVLAGYFIGQKPQQAQLSATSTPTGTATIYNLPSSERLYDILFNQTFFCPQGPGFYGEIAIPWAVTLGNNLTITEPSGAIVGTAVAATSNLRYSLIAFSVPDGTYNFTVYPSGFNIQSGSITVNGEDVAVQLHYVVSSCQPETTTG